MAKAHVLILDDEPAIGRTLSRTLRHAGFEVHVTEEPERALEALRDHDIAVIVCDQKMPKIDGVSFLESCARACPTTVRILLTGYADAQIAADAVNRAGVYRLLWKPWADHEIVEAVRQGAWLHGIEVEDELTPPTPLEPPIDAPTNGSQGNTHN